MILNWKVSAADQANITAIAQRANQMSIALGMTGRWAYKPQDAMMDVTAVHANYMPLALSDLLAADDFDFSHDVFGIRRHIDRDTGRLGNCFVPRYAA